MKIIIRKKFYGDFFGYGERERKYIEKLRELKCRRYTEMPDELLGLRFVASDNNGESYLMVYADFSRETVSEQRHRFEQFNIGLLKLFSKTAAHDGFGFTDEMCNEWVLGLKDADLRRYSSVFGTWKIGISMWDYVTDDGIFDECKAEASCIEYVSELGVFRKYYDKMLQLLPVESFEDFYGRLKKFSKFPVKYVNDICRKNGWTSKGLDYAEICTDGQHIIRYGRDGIEFV